MCCASVSILLDLLLQVVEYILSFGRELQKRMQISALAREPVIQLYVLLEAMPLLKRRLSFLHAIPEARRGNSVLQFLEIGALAGSIKDNLEPALLFPRRPRLSRAIHLTSDCSMK